MDEELKAQATEIAESYGLDLPTAFKMFTKQIVRTRSIPIDLTASEPPLSGNDLLLLQKIARAEKEYEGGQGKSYGSARELFADIFGEDYVAAL